jgi:hypothetical protein
MEHDAFGFDARSEVGIRQGRWSHKVDRLAEQCLEGVLEVKVGARIVRWLSFPEVDQEIEVTGGRAVASCHGAEKVEAAHAVMAAERFDFGKSGGNRRSHGSIMHRCWLDVMRAHWAL